MSTTVSKRSSKAALAVKAAFRGQTLLGGSAAMRAAGEMYLPKFGAESTVDYKARLDGSFLFGAYAKTCEDFVGMLFRKPIELVKAPEAVVGWCDNADMMGNDLSTFMAEVVKDSVRAGLSFVMVDSPRIPEGTSRSDQEEQNIRPYLVHITIDQILDWRTATVNNVQTLSHVRIFETVEEQDPADEFSSVVFGQVRVMDVIEGKVQVRIYRQTTATGGKADGSAYDLTDTYVTGLNEITIVPVYSNRKGFWAAKPMLDDLADLNIRHWQSQSDQNNVLHFARVPILFGAGLDDVEPEENADGRVVDGKTTISAAKMFTARDPNASLAWIKYDPGPIAAGRQDLKDIEFQMQVLGLQLLVATNETATGAALDNAKETTRLGMVADNVKDATETALRWMAAYGAQPEADMSVRVNDDFGVTMMSAQEITALLTAVNTGNLSKETFLEEMKRRGSLRSDLDTEAEVDRIGEALPDLTGNPLDLEDGV